MLIAKDDIKEMKVRSRLNKLKNIKNHNRAQMTLEFVLLSDLKKVNCCPYIHGVRVRLGYSPNGGTIRVKIRDTKTKLAGRTI